MISDILSHIFTPDVVATMGSYWYEVVYSWSVFAVLCAVCLCVVIGFWALIRSLMGWFR